MINSHWGSLQKQELFKNASEVLVIRFVLGFAAFPIKKKQKKEILLWIHLNISPHPLWLSGFTSVPQHLSRVTLASPSSSICWKRGQLTDAWQRKAGLLPSDRSHHTRSEFPSDCPMLFLLIFSFELTAHEKSDSWARVFPALSNVVPELEQRCGSYL